MKKRCFPIGLLICFLLVPGIGFGQTEVLQDYQQLQQQIIQKQKNTRAEIAQLNRQIQKYEERLQLADKKYKALFSKFEDLQQLIALQDQKLSKLQSEQSHIEEEITVTTRSLKEKRNELDTLVENYKKTLGYLYKHGRTSQLAMIFSSSSVNQMLVRSFYLEKFNNYREKQAEEIRKTKKELEQNKQQLEEAQAKNRDVLAEIKEEKQKLAEKKKQQEQNVALLRQNRDQIKSQLQEKQQQKQQLNSTLTELVRKDEKIRNALERYEKERKKKLAAAKKIKDDAKRDREVKKYSKPITMKNSLSSERIEEIETQFAKNKGKLPWPVDSHTISEHFGNRRHPVYGTVTPNLGIKIVTDPQASVRAVQPGYVIDIRPIPGYGDVVVLKHGRFITAYGNLSEIMVRKNEILKRGDMIGLSGNSNSPKGESLFFLIRENNDNLDPENWLQMDTVSSKY